MKLIPYKDALKMGKEKLDATLAAPRAHRAKKQAELEVAKLDEDIATKKATLQEVCSEKDLDFSQIIGLQDTIALTERKKRQFNKIISEMFPGV